MFNYSDIKWAKSIKRNQGTDWAYYEEGSENLFLLNHSKKQLISERKVMAGEIITLFQRPDKIEGLIPKTYLTHLVTPLDNVVVYNKDLPHKFKWERKVAVIARANPRDGIFTSSSQLNFGGHQFGKAYDVGNLNRHLERSEVQKLIWKLFAEHFNEQLDDFLNSLTLADNEFEDTFSAIEGAEREVARKHLIRERNTLVVALAKSRAFAEGGGRIKCTCCSFDFLEAYGSHGEQFIEAHHTLPISTGGVRDTFPEDLAMVCSNCHRMLHRKLFDSNQYHSVDTLRDLVQEQKKIATR